MFSFVSTFFYFIQFQQLLTDFTIKIETALESNRVKYEKELEETRRTYRMSMNELRTITSKTQPNKRLISYINFLFIQLNKFKKCIIVQNYNIGHVFRKCVIVMNQLFNNIQNLLNNSMVVLVSQYYFKKLPNVYSFLFFIQYCSSVIFSLFFLSDLDIYMCQAKLNIRQN